MLTSSAAPAVLTMHKAANAAIRMRVFMSSPLKVTGF